MAGYNANFRNSNTGGASTFNGSADGYQSANVHFIPTFFDGFMTLTCGSTTNWNLTLNSPASFFRTQDFIQNQQYYARQGNFQVDTPGPVDITVVANGFTPFVSFVRNNAVVKQATDGSGIVTYTVANNETGPWTVEVTSVEKNVTGSFSVQISCTPPSPGIFGSATLQNAYLYGFPLVAWTAPPPSLTRYLVGTFGGYYNNSDTGPLETVVGALTYNSPTAGTNTSVEMLDGVPSTTYVRSDLVATIEESGNPSFPYNTTLADGPGLLSIPSPFILSCDYARYYGRGSGSITFTLSTPLTFAASFASNPLTRSYVHNSESLLSSFSSGNTATWPISYCTFASDGYTCSLFTSEIDLLIIPNLTIGTSYKVNLTWSGATSGSAPEYDFTATDTTMVIIYGPYSFPAPSGPIQTTTATLTVTAV